jgi:hypothetical protein
MRSAAPACPPRASAPYPAADGCGFPWDPDRPLVFHTLTSLPEGQAGSLELARLVGSGARLAPPVRRRGSWGEQGKLKITTVDVWAGDDRWLFCSSARPVQGADCWRWEGRHVRPTLGFAVEALQAHGPVGWRFGDLLGVYGRVIQRTVGRRVRRMERYGSPEVEAALRAVADWATITDPVLVRQLVRAHAWHVEHLIRGDLEGQERNRKMVLGLLADRIAHPPVIVDHLRRRLQRQVGWPADGVIDLPGQRGWLRNFPTGGKPPYPSEPRDWLFPPEVVVGGEVPVACALFWQEGQGLDWHRMQVPLRYQMPLRLEPGRRE